MKTKAKKILALIILEIMVLTIVPITKVLAEADDKPIFAISKNIIMKRDETSTLDVSVNEKLEFTHFIAEFDYDGDAIEITGINKGRILPDNAVLDINYGTDDKIIGFEINCSEKMSIDSGNIATINVKTKDNANLGKYEIAWDYTELLKDDNEKINITPQPGSIIITEMDNSNDKPEFYMIYNNEMFPGGEQTIELKADDKMEINYIGANFLYDDNMNILEVTKGNGLPEDTQIIPSYNEGGKIDGFSISSDTVINLNKNDTLANIKVKALENTENEKTTFSIDTNWLIQGNWKAANVKNITAEIEIEPKVTPPSIEKAYIIIKRNELFVGEKEQVQVVVEPENAANFIEKIEYSSSDPTIATVDENGIIKAINPGKVKINAIINDQFTSEVEVTVTNPDIPNTGDMPITLFISMMAISLVGIISITIVNRKN